MKRISICLFALLTASQAGAQDSSPRVAVTCDNVAKMLQNYQNRQSSSDRKTLQKMNDYVASVGSLYALLRSKEGKTLYIGNGAFNTVKENLEVMKEDAKDLSEAQENTQEELMEIVLLLPTCLQK